MSETMATLFGADQHLTVAQECARTLLVFAWGFVLLRLAGRRLFGKWSAVDIVVSIIIGSNFSRTITGNAPLVGTLAASTLLMALHWLVSHLAARSRAASTLLEGMAIDLVAAGSPDDRARRRHGVSHADIDEALRAQGLRSVGEVERLTLEPSGKMTVRKDKG